MTTVSTNMAHSASDVERGVQQYKQITKRKSLILTVLLALLLGSVALDISLGPARYSIGEVISTLLHPGSSPIENKVIIWDIRLPVALMAVLVGASLAVAGAEMQTILNNPLASPFTLGISAAASFGASLAIVGGVSVLPFLGGLFFISGNAFLFAMGASLVIYFLSQMRGVTSETIILLGIAMVFLFNALLALMQYVATEEALQQLVFWTLGSLGRATWSKIGIAAVVFFGTLPLFLRQVWQLTALRLGDEKARSMGISVERLRLTVLLTVSALSSVIVAFVGTIGFVGLVGPHCARMMVGEDQRFFLPASALSGGLLMSVASIVSKSIRPGAIIPVGIVTSLVGIPFFLSLILLRRRQAWQ